MPLSLTLLPPEIILRIYNESWVKDPMQPRKPLNEDIVNISETCSQLRAIALPLLFKEVRNWRKNPYIGGAWPSTVWPYIRVVSVYDECRKKRFTLFNNVDLLSTLPNLANVSHVRLNFVYAAPNLLDAFTLPFLLAIATLPQLETLDLRQFRFDGPSLAHAFAQMQRLTSLTLTITPHIIEPLGSEEYNHFDELSNVAGILQVLAPVLTELEISGDIIDLPMFESTAWPNLFTLRLVDHVPYTYFRPLAAIVTHMPMLQTLACDFNAEENPRIPFIFCPLDDHGRPPLSIAIPNLSSLSLSNLQPGDQSVRQLPSNLRVLRIVALRDMHLRSIGDLEREPRYHYSALSDDDAYLWIKAASELLHLSKLTLGLKSVPSPNLLQHIAQACPGLQYLELEQASFEHNYDESPDSVLELLITPLASLLHLRELRMSVELGPALVWVEPVRARLPSLVFKARVETAAMLFAARLQNLDFLGFSALNVDLTTYGRHSVWYMFKIIRNEDGLRIQVTDPI